MLKGLLRPRASDTNPWLFAIAKASRNALHGQRKQLYPKRIIWLDMDAKEDGDGSYFKPINNLERILADDTLECVCKNLCADKITVRIKGDISATIGNEASRSQADAFSLIDGKNRNYARHLVFRPWEDSERLKVKVFCEIPITVQEYNRIDVKQFIYLVHNLHGLKWMNCDFEIILRIIADKEPELLQISSLAELICIEKCQDNIFVNCSFSNKVLIDVLWREPVPDSYPWPGSGGGGGDGIGGGGPGGGGGYYPWPGVEIPWDPLHPYPWPGDPAEDLPPAFSWSGIFNAAIMTCALRDSGGAIIREGYCKLEATVYSNLGAKSECFALLNCPDSYSDEHFSAKITALAKVSGSGEEYSNSQGSGVRQYCLAAEATAAGFSNCKNSIIKNSSAQTKAEALSIGGNTPHHTNKDGETRTYPVYGFSQAISSGFRNNDNSIFEGLSSQSYAKAEHPTLWGYLQYPYFSNKNAEYKDCSGSEKACKSIDPSWCPVDGFDTYKE